MVFKIKFKSSVKRDLKKIDKTKLKNIFDKIETELSEKADQLPLLTGKFAGLRKYRIEDYRVIYTLLEDSVFILRIAYRKEAYR